MGDLMTATTKLRRTAFQVVVLTIVSASTGAQELGRKVGEAEDLLSRRPIPAISRTILPAVRSIPLAGQSASGGARRGKPANRPNPTAKLDGRILFHRYTNYDAWDSRLYLYEFGTKRLRCLSELWEIDHAINGNFSPDGKQVVFMGVP
jgi:hypothetical protein